MAKRIRERERLEEAREGRAPWRKWGPYLSERQWGTVREDYSSNGDAWNHFPHDHARSRAYHWGEDGLAGWSDDKQLLCFAIALWNGRDPILKERLFGLTNGEGNHGEDVKEYYFYLDATPTHSYQKWLYKYPQREFPYLALVQNNAARGRGDFEYELLDTGVFADNRYFDVFVEYAKASPEDIVARITVVNRGPETAPLHVLPTLWFRNTWSWWPEEPRPSMTNASAGSVRTIRASHPVLGDRWLYLEGEAPLLFTENETNTARLGGPPSPTPSVKDAFHEYVIRGRRDAVSPTQTGTKAAACFAMELAPGRSTTLRLRLTHLAPDVLRLPLAGVDATFTARIREADELYAELTPPGVSVERAMVMRQALAGMLWTKQFYFFDVERWLDEHGTEPTTQLSRATRNREWSHMMNAHVISMPDKWEYPWFAAWDLAFHAVALASVDLDFAKQQLSLMLREIYQHPNGQMAAYEWNFGDVNPPVQPWATIFTYRIEQAFHGRSDIDFLKHSFGKLLTNFTWWVNRKDRFGRNVFEGGFLGLDNIGVFDRSAPLPTGGHLEQADGTAWVALFCQNMLEIAAEIAAHDPVYEDLAAEFVDHFLLIAHAMNRVGPSGMWDEEDGFYYDVLCRPDGQAERLRVRSVVGLLPLCATTVVEPWQRERLPRLEAYAQARMRRRPELARSIHPTGPEHRGVHGRGILALLDQHRLRRVLARMLDEEEFLSPHGIRSLSRVHRDHPYVLRAGGEEFRVAYLPAESDSGMFGGNSNWRGPVWMPINVLIIRALMMYYAYYGDSFRVEHPTRSGRYATLFEVAEDLGSRLVSIFLRGPDGRRPVFGGQAPFQTDPHWRDCLLFYEYFHGDNGAGIGASHQTGWTGVVATLIRYFGMVGPENVLLSRPPPPTSRREPPPVVHAAPP